MHRWTSEKTTKTVDPLLRLCRRDALERSERRPRRRRSDAARWCLQRQRRRRWWRLHQVCRHRPHLQMEEEDPPWAPPCRARPSPRSMPASSVASGGGAQFAGIKSSSALLPVVCHHDPALVVRCGCSTTLLRVGIVDEQLDFVRDSSNAVRGRSDDRQKSQLVVARSAVIDARTRARVVDDVTRTHRVVVVVECSLLPPKQGIGRRRALALGS